MSLRQAWYRGFRGYKSTSNDSCVLSRDKTLHPKGSETAEDFTQDSDSIGGIFCSHYLENNVEKLRNQTDML